MEVDANSNNTIITSEPSTSNQTPESSSRLGLCEVCAFRDAKYTCPRCEVKTCSLRCNKIHKLEIECNGERDRTKFITLNKFTNLDLSSDYRLLEEINRSLETSKKNFGSKWSRQFRPDVLFKLQRAARFRKVTLKFLPDKFERRKINTTRFQPKNNQILWHIEWVFVNANNLKVYDEKVPETDKLSSVLSKYFTQNDERLQYYQAAGMAGVKLYLKAEQKQGKKFYELDMNNSLKECLKKKLIIEFPIIHVLLKDHGCGYAVIDSDDEDEGDEESKNTNKTTKTGNEIVNKIIESTCDDDIYESLKNLLFISEYSEEEMST